MEFPNGVSIIISMSRFGLSWGVRTSGLFLTLTGLFFGSVSSAFSNPNVYVSRFWHNHQPIYWPEWNSLPQPERVQFAQDSINLKMGQVYDSGGPHPENDLSAIFSVPDRVNAYQGGPTNSLAKVTNGGYAMSYSGSLIDNVASLGTANALGYGPGWWNGNRAGRNWTTSGGSRKLDLVGFTYHHSLGAVLPKEVFRKEIQIFKEAYYKAWNTGSVTNHSKGFFPTEMAFSRHMVDVLSDEGYEWVIVASHHLSRTLPAYMGSINTSPESGNWNIHSTPPNNADQVNSTSGGGWWFGSGNINPIKAYNHAPFAYQLHRAKFINPETGQEKTILMVPSDDILSYQYGYGDEGVGKITSFISPYVNDPSRPAIIVPSTDGDNAWGGGDSSWGGAAPGFMNNGTYPGVAIQDFVNQHGGAAQPVHIEDGAWIFPESDWGSPNFLKWVEPPVANTTATNRVPNTVVDIETPGFSSKFYSWAPVIAGANWCQTAEQMTVGEGGMVQAWKIQDPYDNLNSRTYQYPNLAERAWHIYLAGLDSGFNYYGGEGNDDEVKTSLATRRAYELLNTYVNSRKATNDQIPPTVFKPQRFPYNPGTYTFGWFNSSPGGNTSYLKKMNSEFYIWTFAYDVSGITNIVLKVRKDNDGTNSFASKVNEVYNPAALGLNTNEVGAWVSIPMTKRILPSTAAALTAAANNSKIAYFDQAVSPVVADYYFARIDNSSFPNFRNNLFDYYIEATDARGNVSKSDIQHVFVADDAGGTGGGGGGGGTPTGPVVTSPSPPVAGQLVTVTYSGSLASGASVNIHHGFNGANWTAVPGVAMTKSGSNWVFSYTVPSAATNITMVFNFNGQEPWDNNGNSNYNFSVTNLPITDPPPAPTGLAATNTTSTSATLSWNPVLTASGYLLFRNNTQVVATSGTNHTDTGLSADTTYSYTVRATNSAGQSGSSSGLNITTLFTPLIPSEIRLLTATNPAQVTGGSFLFRGRAGPAFTNGLIWSNSLTTATGSIEFPGGNVANGWEWNTTIVLGAGSNQVTFTGSYTGSPTQVLTDSPTNYTAWSNGATGGSGFGVWALSTSNGPAGNFLGSTSANPDMNVGSSNGFGLWGNPGTSTARRDFNTPMAAGDSFALRFDNNSVANGGEVGFTLADSSNNPRFRFYFVGGQSNYRITDATTARDSGLAYISSGLNLTVTLTSSNTYTFSNGATNLTGTLALAGGPVSRLIVENKAAGANNNLYFGSMTHTRSMQESGSNSVTAATLTYVPTTDGIPDSWWEFSRIPIGSRFALADTDGDGFNNAQEFSLGTDPMDPSSSLKTGAMSRDGNLVTISWSSVAGKTYQVQKRASLTSGDWTSVQSVTALGTNASATVNVSDAPNGCFLRIKHGP